MGFEQRLACRCHIPQLHSTWDSVLYTSSARALVRMVTNDEMPVPSPVEMEEANEKSASDILVEEVLDFTAMQSLSDEEGGVNGVEKHPEVRNYDACMYIE